MHPRSRVLPLTVVAVVVLAALAALPATAAAAGASARIVGGGKPSDEQYGTRLRSLVALVSMSAASQYDGQFCGGSLIDDDHVLTAAHCVVENDPYDYRSAPSSIGVLVGTRTLNARSLVRSQLVPVRTIFVHPYFNLKTFRYDIAILRLARPVTDVPTIPLLAQGESDALGIGASEVPALAAGWGDTDTARDGCCFPVDLQSINQTIHTAANCTANLKNSATWRFNADLQLCSGAVGRDTCQGDSGGPLVVDVSGSPRLAGIVSHGVGCGEGYYGIYARASALRDWVAALPGTTAGDARDPSHGFDDTTAPTVVSSTPAGYSSSRVVVAPGEGAAPVRYTAYLRAGAPASAEDVYLGSFARTSFTVPVPPSRSTASYQVVIRGVTDNGETPGANARLRPKRDLVAPTAPGGVRASLADGRLTVTWRAGVDRQGGVEGYLVQRRSSGRWSAPKLVEAPATRLVVRTGAHGQVRVRTRDWAGNLSAWATAAY